MSPRWGDLPLEMRREIFQELSAGYSFTYAKRRYHDSPLLSQYASVCREWQSYFEDITFRQLILDPSDLPFFKETVDGANKRRFSCIRYVRFYIILETYDCSVCRKPEDESTIARNNLVFTDAMDELLTILSRANGSTHRKGLTLELSVHSPSDYEHVYRDFRLDREYPFVTEDDLRDGSWYIDYHMYRIRQKWLTKDMPHGLHGLRGNTARRQQPRVGDKKRLRGTENLSFNFRDVGKVLPRVDIVRGLVTRRQFYRNISVYSLAWLLTESLQSLETFRYEQFTEISKSLRALSREDFQNLLLPCLPASLKRLYIFQEYHPYLVDEPISHSECLPGEVLAQYSFQLTELSPGQHIDGEGFLRAFRPCLPTNLTPDTHSWPNLEYIVLSVPALVPGRMHYDVPVLLSMAGSAASCMPKLKTMELWNASKSSAAIFRYWIHDGVPNVKWRSTWQRTCGVDLDFLVHPDLMQRWRETASCHSHRPLTFYMHRLRRNALKAKGRGVFEYLELKRLVLDPRSLFQMNFEMKFASAI